MIEAYTPQVRIILRIVNLSRPYAAVSPQVSGDVLVVLARTTGQMTGRHVARLVRHGNPKAVNTALERLVAQGLVLRTEVPPAYLYVLNRDHLGYPAVAALANIRVEFIARLEASFEAWELKPVHASLFGSAARSDGDENSDIDIFLIRPRHIDDEDETWQDQRASLRTDVESWTGNPVSLIEFSDERVTTMGRDALAPMLSDGLLLSGTALADLIETAPAS
jgi:predicted nucleotidyltransferase